MVHAYALSKAKLKTTKSIRNEKGGIAIPPLHNSIINALTMIDWGKIPIFSPDKAKWFLNHSPFKDGFTTKVYTNTGELNTTNRRGKNIGELKVYDTEELKLSVWNNYVSKVECSLHKFLKGENHSDFTYSQLHTAVNTLADTLQLYPDQLDLCGLEFGTNTRHSFDVFNFCENLIATQGNGFIPMQGKPLVGYTWERAQFAIKAYTKDLQSFGAGNSLLRYEVRAIKMQYLNSTGIKTLADLLDKEKLDKLGQLFLKSYPTFAVNDIVDISLLTANEREFYLTYSNPNNWRNLSYKNRARILSRFHSITNRYGSNQWRGEAYPAIGEKWQYLLSA